MKIVFLDVDGVLVHQGTVSRGRGVPPVQRNLASIDRECIGLLRDVLIRTEAHIVLASTWRLSEAQTEALMLALEEVCIPRSALIDKTCNRTAMRGPIAIPSRGHQIQDWLDQAGPSIEAYVWIDDEPAQPEHSHPVVHVRQGWTTGGLNRQHAELAIELLTKRAGRR